MSDPSEPIRLEVESVNDAIDESDETDSPVEHPDQADVAHGTADYQTNSENKMPPKPDTTID